MGSLFSKTRRASKADDRISDNDRALLQLKVTKNRLAKHRAGIVRTIEREGALAREHASHEDRLRARDALRRRRYWEMTLDKTNAMLEQLDAVLAGIELAQLNKVVYDGLREGTAALKQMQRELSLEKVERLMDERADALAVQDAVDNALGSASDSALELQLEQLEADAVALKLPSAPQAAVAASTAVSSSSYPAPPLTTSDSRARELPGVAVMATD